LPFAGATMDGAGSIIFDYGRPGERAAGGKRHIPNAPTQVSVDNPLYFGPNGGVTHHSVIQRTQNTAMERFQEGPPPMNNPTWHAGRRSGGDQPIGVPRTQPRTEYQHPNFQIHRSQKDSGAKDLLYGGMPVPAAAAPQSAAPQSAVPSGGAVDHPAWPAYEYLAQAVPSLPRDADGHTEEASVRGMLEAMGIGISNDGLAELLARCDVSPNGFPPFADFMLCLSREDRAPKTAELLPPQSENVPPSEFMPHAEHMPPSARAPEQEAPHAQAKATHFAPELEQLATQQPKVAHAASYALPTAYNEAVMKEQTWRHMQMAKNMASIDQFQPSARMAHTPVHGIPSTRDHEKYSAAAAVMAKNKANSNAAEEALRASVAHGTTARLGVGAPRPVGSFPLGAKSYVKPLGLNGADVLHKKTHAASQNFTNSFGPDPFF